MLDVGKGLTNDRLGVGIQVKAHPDEVALFAAVLCRLVVRPVRRTRGPQTRGMVTKGVGADGAIPDRRFTQVRSPLTRARFTMPGPAKPTLS
jgi:hypothetical protein